MLRPNKPTWLTILPFCILRYWLILLFMTAKLVSCCSLATSPFTALQEQRLENQRGAGTADKRGSRACKSNDHSLFYGHLIVAISGWRQNMVLLEHHGVGMWQSSASTPPRRWTSTVRTWLIQKGNLLFSSQDDIFGHKCFGQKGSMKGELITDSSEPDKVWLVLHAPCCSATHERRPTKIWAFLHPLSTAGVSEQAMSVATHSLRWWTLQAGFLNLWAFWANNDWIQERLGQSWWASFENEDPSRAF